MRLRSCFVPVVLPLLVLGCGERGLVDGADEGAEIEADPEALTLGRFVGRVDLRTGDFSLEPMEVLGTSADALSTLPELDADKWGTGQTAPGTTANLVALEQVARITQANWNTTTCGSAPTSGVCAQIRFRSMFPDEQILRSYVEFTSLVPRAGGVTTNVSFTSNTTTDADLGVTANTGLLRVGRVSRRGVNGGAPLAWWSFKSTSPGPATFDFIAIVKGKLVAPIARASVATGTGDLPSGGSGYGGATIGNAASGSQNRDSRTVLSADGRYLAFESEATNLVASGTSTAGVWRVYRHDFQTKATVLVSGANATNCASTYPTISADGSKVAFRSECTLVPADTDRDDDVYVTTVGSGSFQLASTDSVGTKANRVSYAPYLSKDGSFVVFENAASNLRDQFGGTKPNGAAGRQIWRKELATGTLLRVAVGPSNGWNNSDCWVPQCDQSCSRIVFASDATNLIGGDTNSDRDVFLASFGGGVTPTLTRLSLKANGTQAQGISDRPAISADGTTVTFQSTSNDIVSGLPSNPRSQIYVRSVASAATLALVSRTATVAYGNGASRLPTLSRDGRVVLFQSAANNLDPGVDDRDEIFIVDLRSNDPALRAPNVVSRTEQGAMLPRPARVLATGPLEITDDAEYIAFPALGNYVPGSGTTFAQVYRSPTN
jgi:hypothetical protein